VRNELLLVRLIRTLQPEKSKLRFNATCASPTLPPPSYTCGYKTFPLFVQQLQCFFINRCKKNRPVCSPLQLRPPSDSNSSLDCGLLSTVSHLVLTFRLHKASNPLTHQLCFGCRFRVGSPLLFRAKKKKRKSMGRRVSFAPGKQLDEIRCVFGMLSARWGKCAASDAVHNREHTIEGCGTHISSFTIFVPNLNQLVHLTNAENIKKLQQSGTTTVKLQLLQRHLQCHQHLHRCNNLLSQACSMTKSQNL
jgi:hypothetical protein